MTIKQRSIDTALLDAYKANKNGETRTNTPSFTIFCLSHHAIAIKILRQRHEECQEQLYDSLYRDMLLADQVPAQTIFALGHLDSWFLPAMI